MKLFSQIKNLVGANGNELFRFVIVGATTFFINFGLFHIFYSLINIDSGISVSIAYWVTVCCHFYLNRSFTFRAVKQHFGSNLVKYAGMLLVNYMIALGSLWIVVNMLHQSPYYSVVLSTSITAINSFTLMKLFVFRQSNKK